MRLEELRARARRDAEVIAMMLVDEFDVSRVVLFGSLKDSSGFAERSDIDLAVMGLDPYYYLKALAKAGELTDFIVDIKPVEEASPLLKKRIEQGIVLHEKRADT